MAGNGYASRNWKGVFLSLSKFQYLRISVIDACNLRCKFCNPEGSFRRREKYYILPHDIGRIIEFFTYLGAHKVRITGGEPLLRSDIVEIIKTVASFEDIRDIALTTNGMLLKRYIEELKMAGLMRVNVSLSSLNPERFKQLTSGDLNRVIDGIDFALRLNMPVKINVVAYGEELIGELDNFIGFISKRDLILRFIEYMPVCSNLYNRDKFVRSEFVENILISKYRFETRNIQNQMVDRIYFRSDLKGKIGFIKPVSRQFCDICNKVRINCYGELRPCLFSTQKINVLKLIKDYDFERSEEILTNFVQKNNRTPELKRLIKADHLPETRLFEIGG